MLVFNVDVRAFVIPFGFLIIFHSLEQRVYIHKKLNKLYTETWKTTSLDKPYLKNKTESRH